MNFKHNKLRDAVVIALVATAGTATTAVAQESASPTNLDRIEVTGSRIRSVDVENSQPVFIMDRAAIEKQGLTSVADVLQRISANGAGLNTNFNNGGDGSSTISLRNLGSERTLVLVNGRRWVSNTSGSVDLNTIPASIIERVEVLKDGASSVYGSDAIAGVVNLITRGDYEGAEVNAYVGQYGQGDGQRTSFDATVGTSSDRGNLVISVSRVEEDAVSAGDRAISAVPEFGRGSATYSSYSANGKINASAAAGGNLALRPGAIASGLASDPYYALNQYIPYTSDFNYNFAKDNYLATPQKRSALFAQGSYNLSDNITFKMDALYNERRSAQQLAGFPLSTINTGLSLSGDSYYNPYNAAYGGDGRDVSWTHRLTEASRLYDQNTKTSHVYLGLDGFFEFAGRQFNWDAGYAFNKTNEVETQVGDANLLSLEAALGASEVRGGRVVCVDGPGGDIISGCTPFNPLSPAGGVSQEMLDYILFTAHNTYQYRNESVTANLSGELFELPAGWLSFAAGFEHRKESGYSSPDAFIANGLTSGNSFTATSGEYSLDDAYIEVAIPLLKDLPGAQLLELSAATRYSDYSNFGNTLNSKFGFKWKPLDEVLVRGNWAEGFRAPSITNLYRGDSDTFATYSDPCSGDGRFAGNAGVQANCAARGVPAGFVADYNSGGGVNGGQTIYPFTLGGNPDLTPETATSKTLGVVYSPSWATGLNISLDWWSIELENRISSFAANTILDKCYVDNISSYCDLITRDATGLVTGMFIGPINAGFQELEGYDLTVKYRLADTSVGTFGFTLDSTYVTKNRSRDSTQDDWEALNGKYFESDPYWRLRGNLTTDWTYGDFSASWMIRYRSGLTEDVSEGTLESITYHDLQLSYNLPWNATVRVGANNIFAKDPPVTLDAFANSFDPQYDIPGRYMYMQYTQRF
ncbi:iron complex outermembrane receptor protein [Stenotrophomonas rhizophila]|uniref:TonB-dependent receptor n=1 Tax=Stenotrophomonas TaxID=40323 RepID=UPI000F4B8D35|nr:MULTISPECIES: TonB-dependent receptor [Stenotrophomonas]MCW6028328.1 TonB-dependent receptor [Stenotrophomonas sp. SRS1]ROP76903.1 iron complex outermembrane receptor protein [Stenotrophomonas rhizophila]